MTGPAISARRIGTERQPIATVDGFHPEPDALRAAAAAAAFEPARHLYPGIRGALPPDYFAQVRPTLEPVLREVFGATGIDLIDASFSMVTTRPEALTLAQRLPHVDGVEPGRIALVHYLQPDGSDGTAFFRHRATGFETLDAARRATYDAALARDLAETPEPQGYAVDGDPVFERIAAVEARYNRAVIYRSALFHSGAISPRAALSADPATGRLTITAFFSGRA